MLAVAPSIHDYLAHEAALRAQHGPGALYVKPQIYAIPNAPGAGLVVGGWAFLDGEPAIVPEGLHVLVIAHTAADGSMVQLGRDPSRVLTLLAPYAQRYTSPCPHTTVRVPPSEVARLRALIEALPEHDPMAPPAPTYYPLLKEATFAHRDRVVTAPFPGLSRADAPIVAFATETPNGYSLLTRDAAPNADGRALLADVIANLAAREAELAFLSPAIGVSVGQPLSAERILDRNFLRSIHDRLGPEIWVCIPHRVGLFALRAGAADSDVLQFVHLVRADSERAIGLGHAPVSPLAFHVVDGLVIEALSLDALLAGGASAGKKVALNEAEIAPNVPNPSHLVRVDPATKRIHLVVVVVGSGAKRYARAVYSATTSDKSPLGPVHDAELEHYVVQLGDIRGWATYMLFYALDDTLGCLEMAARFSPHASIVIAAQAPSAPALEPPLHAVASAKRDQDAVTVVLGSQGAGADWARRAGSPADVVASPEDDAMATLKRIAKLALGRLPAA
jgi:hypothetical protein